MSQKKSPEDEDMTRASILEYFATIPDPRIERSRLHPLTSILVLSLIAVICGADSFVAIAEFGRAREVWLRTFLDLPNGIPSHDTLGRVFAMLNPKALQEAFRKWTSDVSEGTDGDVIPIDGKTLRRSFRERGMGFVHMVSAWSVRNQLVLAQIKTEEKSNEITAIPQLLDLLNIKDATVTIDAMGCQKEIAKKIVEGGGDYMLAVKDNQPTLVADVVDVFEQAHSDPQQAAMMSFHQTEDNKHGRKELRRCWTTKCTDDVTQRDQWEGLQSLVMIESERTVAGKTTFETRHYISSRRHLSAAEAMANARSHWSIENGLHWVLDMAFREDDSRIRAGNAAENFAVVRHFALNLLKAVKNSKVGIKNRRLRAAWDTGFLFRVLAALS